MEKYFRKNYFAIFEKLFFITHTLVCTLKINLCLHDVCEHVWEGGRKEVEKDVKKVQVFLPPPIYVMLERKKNLC